MQFLGNEKIVERIKEWAAKWERGMPQKPLLLHGPPGCGKTTLAYILAKEMGWEIVETNASDARSKKKLEENIGPAAGATTLSGGRRLVVVDEVDGIDTKSDRGAVSAMMEMISGSTQPMILLANDPYGKKIKDFKAVAEFIELKPVDKRSMAKFLKFVTASEELEADDLLIKDIVDKANGDVRSALIDLQNTSPHDRNRKMDIFKGMGHLFKAMDFETAKRIPDQVGMDPEFFFLWIEENIPREYKKPEDICRAYEALSRADVFEGRIYRRQNWKLRKFSIDLATAGVALAKKERYKDFINYQFPSIINRMSAIQMKRAMLKKICGKIASRTHVSSSFVRQNMFFIAPIAIRNPQFFEFDDEELDFLELYSRDNSNNGTYNRY
jgi:replication factor C large subunit